MKTLVLLLLATLTLFGADTLHVFGYQWTVPQASDWKIDQEDGTTILHLLSAKEPLPGPRRPIQFAVAQTPDFNHVTVRADVRPLKRSLMIVYAYRDAAHFNYAHLSTDTGTKQPVHNGIFHVYGGERVRISSPLGRAAFPESNRWYHVDLTYDGPSGTVQVKVDDHLVPALRAVDLSLGSGKVGLGSFNETADFKNVKISGMRARTEPVWPERMLNK
jgi:hypothetical protein